MDMAKLNDTNVLVTSYLIKGPVIFTLYLVWNINGTEFAFEEHTIKLPSTEWKGIGFYYCLYKNLGHFDYNCGFNLGY